VGAGPGAPDLLTLHAAQRYQVVVRLKGGDPMLFGRAQEEIDHLRAVGIAASA
jgi:siroheme synthase